MIATVVNVFCLLFAVILALIAMANVFNTVTNSLILRRREFAVMKSVGLSNRQFQVPWWPRMRRLVHPRPRARACCCALLRVLPFVAGVSRHL